MSESCVHNPFAAAAREEVIEALIEFDRELGEGVFRFEAFGREEWRE